jgi:hypothetical protein
MKKILTLLFAITISFSILNAQDIIHFRHLEIRAKVVEINKAFIKYKKYDNPDGPTYSLPKNYADSIVYANGTIDKFRKERFHHEPTPYNKVKVDYKGQNFISTGLWIYDNFGTDINYQFTNPSILASYVCYETNIIKNRVGLAVTPFVGLNNNAYGGALAARFNLKWRGNFMIGVGPEYVLASQNVIQRYYDNDNGIYITRKYKTAASFLYFNVSMKLHLTPEICITHEVNLGGMVGNSNVHKNVPTSWSSSSTGSFGGLKLGIAYRF